MTKLILSFFLIFIPMPLYAYIGPGMGGGVLAIVIGFFAAIFLALLGILYYPIKRAFKRRKDNKNVNKH